MLIERNNFICDLPRIPTTRDKLRDPYGHGLSLSLQMEDEGMRLTVYRHGKWRNLKVGPFGLNGDYGKDEPYTTHVAFKALADANSKSRRVILSAINWQGKSPLLEWIKWKLK